MSNCKRNFTITKFEDSDISNKDETDDILDFYSDNTKTYKEKNETKILDTVESPSEINQLISQNIIEEDINNEKIHIFQCIDEIDTFVINSSNIYTLSVLGLIDKLIIKYNFKINNVKNYISSSFGTLVSVYLAFGYLPKDILLIFFEKIKLNGNILNIHQKYGIFELDIFIDELLKPLFDKIGYIPTLMDIYKETGKNIVFLSYNLTLHKSAYFDFKNNPNDRIDILVKTCCNIPIIFTKYLYNEHEYTDYTFISTNNLIPCDNNDVTYYTITSQNNEELISINKRLVFDVNITKNTCNDIKNMNIAEYIFYIFESLYNQNIKKQYGSKELNITINTNSYDITLFMDNTQRYKELIKLYEYGFKTQCEFLFKTIEKKEEKHICKKQIHFDGVVFSGGGMNVFSLAGMYDYLYRNYKNNIKILIGTSSGSMMSCLLAMNFEPNYVYKFISEFKFSENIQNSLKNIYITESIQNKGLINNNIILNYLENVFTKYNNGIIPTFLDIKNKYDKELVCVTYNITKNKLEYLNYKNSPDLLVTYACVMSSCIPIIFNPFEYKNNLYVDGFIGSNFPVEYTSKYKDLNFACFGFDTKINSHSNIVEYLMKILYEKININEKRKIDLNMKNCEFFIYNKVTNSNPLFISKEEMLKKYNDGYSYISKLHKNN